MPDAVNEAPQIAKVITYLSIIVAAAFSVLFIIALDPWVTELIVGTAYFLSILNIIYYYFGPKVRNRLPGSVAVHTRPGSQPPFFLFLVLL